MQAGTDGGHAAEWTITALRRRSTLQYEGKAAGRVPPKSSEMERGAWLCRHTVYTRSRKAESEYLIRWCSGSVKSKYKPPLDAGLVEVLIFEKRKFTSVRPRYHPRTGTAALWSLEAHGRWSFLPGLTRHPTLHTPTLNLYETKNKGNFLNSTEENFYFIFKIHLNFAHIKT